MIELWAGKACNARWRRLNMTVQSSDVDYHLHITKLSTVQPVSRLFKVVWFLAVVVLPDFLNFLTPSEGKSRWVFQVVGPMGLQCRASSYAKTVDQWWFYLLQCIQEYSLLVSETSSQFVAPWMTWIWKPDVQDLYWGGLNTELASSWRRSQYGGGVIIKVVFQKVPMQTCTYCMHKEDFEVLGLRS